MKTLRLCILLAVLQLLLVLVSWLLTAAMPDLAMRSLLSPEGIRWFFGHFTENIAQPLLVWLILFYIAFISYRHGGLQRALSSLIRGERLMLRHRSGLWLVLWVFLIMVISLLLLVVLPRSVLTSVTGDLFPSSFSAALIPSLAFILFVSSVTFSVVTGQMRQFRRPYKGRFSVWLLVYVLGMTLYQSLRFVFG